MSAEIQHDHARPQITGLHSQPVDSIQCIYDHIDDPADAVRFGLTNLDILRIGRLRIQYLLLSSRT